MRKYYVNRIDENRGYAYHQVQGEPYKTEMPFTLFVYHSDETYEEGKCWWYVCEDTTGVAISRGRTKKEACELAESSMKSLGAKALQKSIDRCHELYGYAPGHGITENIVSNGGDLPYYPS